MLLTVFIMLFLRPLFGFAQQNLSELAGDLDELSKDITGALPFVASIGLIWPDNYIGQLIDIPPHWGFGITLGTTTLKLDKLNTLLEKFGFESDDGFMDKQLMPAYTVEARVGGFRSVPFDLGVKWGWLPYLPLFKDDINYESCVYGLDFRWEIMRDWGRMPSMSVGLEVDRATGGLRRKSSVSLQEGSLGPITVSGDGTAGAVWEAWVFDLKLHAAKKFWEPRITVYAGLRLGAALTRTGYQLAGGGDITINTSGSVVKLEDLAGSSQTTLADSLASASGNGMKFEVTDDDITGWIDSYGVNFNTYEGISIEFEENKFNINIALLVDLLHFEIGAVIGFRYQQ
jgi:hypothetical protein